MLRSFLKKLTLIESWSSRPWKSLNSWHFSVCKPASNLAWKHMETFGCYHYIHFEDVSDQSYPLLQRSLKGCGMGTLFVLVCPCFRGKVVVTCKIGSFLCSLDNLLQKNVIVFFFGNQISKCRSFEKRAIFDLLFTFLVTREKLQKFLQHISHSHTYMYFAHPIDFFALPILKKKYEFIRYGFSLVWVLVLILIRTILEQSINNKMVSKF